MGRFGCQCYVVFRRRRRFDAVLTTLYIWPQAGAEPSGPRRGEVYGHRHHSRDRGRSPAISRRRPARQIVDRADQTADHAARSVARLFARCRLSLPAHPAPAEHGLRLHLEGQFRRGDLERHRRPRPRRPRRAGGEAGHGGQGGAVQALCRHRFDRPGDRHQGCRRIRQLRALPAPGLWRHQPRGHPRPGMLRDRGAAARVARHPGIPRRPARHRDHHRGGADQRAAPDRTRAGRAQDRRQRRRRCLDRLRRVAEDDGAAARKCRAVRYQGGDLPRPHRGHEPVEIGACGRHRGAHARRGDRRRRRVPRSLGQGRGRPGDGSGDGRQADHLRDGQSRPGDHPGGGARGAGRRNHRHRPIGLSEPGQQRPRFPLHLPRRARRACLGDQRRDEDRRGRGAGAAGARGCPGRGGRRLFGAAAALRARLHHPGAVRPAPHLGGAGGGGTGGDGFRRREEADP